MAFKEKSRAQARAYRERCPEVILFLTAKNKARRSGIPFNLDKSDIVIPKLCPYMQVPITNIRGSGRHPYNPSIDRIDPKLGYVKGNIQIISDLANRMKQDATPEQLIFFAKGVLKYYNDT